MEELNLIIEDRLVYYKKYGTILYNIYLSDDF